MANTIDIIIQAIDKTGGVLSGITSHFDGLEEGFNNMLGLAQPFVQFMQDSIDYTRNYGVAVEDFSRITGISLEDTSKLIQAASDFGVEYDTLMKGVETATKRGKEITVEELGIIADEYVALGEEGGPVAQAKYLIDTFGQAGLDMGALFEEGKDGILSAMGEVDDALIWDEGQASKLDAYNEAIGNLDQAFGGLKITLATELLPTLTDVFNKINDIVGGFSGFEDKFDTFRRKMETFGNIFDYMDVGWLKRENDYVLGAADSWDDYNYQMREAINLSGGYVDGYGRVHTTVGTLVDGVMLLTEEQWNLKFALDETKPVLEETGEKARNVAEKFGGMMNAADGANGSIGILKSTVDGFPSDTTAKFTLETSVTGELAGLFGTGGGGAFRFGLLDTGETKRGTEEDRGIGDAWGGWESANTPYLVGERGPELFVPGTSGKIIPNNQLGGGGGSEIDYDRLTRSFVEALERSSLVR